MFEVAEVGRRLDRDDYRVAEPEVHARLLALQQRLRETPRSLIIIVAGVEGAGKGEVVDKLNRWFDSRDVQTHAFWDESDEERERPPYWRYWRTLPARGKVSIMFSSWYSRPLADKLFRDVSESEFEAELQRVVELERTLARDGAILVKLWFHLTRDQQQQRLSEEAGTARFKQSPLIADYAKVYDQFIGASERVIRQTDYDLAPWHIIEASDRHYRDITAGRTVLAALEEGLASKPAPSESELAQETSVLEAILARHEASLTVLDQVDLERRLEDGEYGAQLELAQERLHRLAWDMHRAKRNAVLVFEGWDAAGKGSAIRRVIAAMDARLYRVIPVRSPTDEELAHHYLWRFWRHVPRPGFMTLYDRSWYGRVLVERVEGIADQHAWLRSYQEINDFEEHLTRHGTVLLKFWIHISKAEQLARFRDREQDPRKHYKLTEEDWRNREKWDQYEQAVNDMVAHTSTVAAPWNLVAGNDKKYARVSIINLIADRLERILGA